MNHKEAFDFINKESICNIIKQYEHFGSFKELKNLETYFKINTNYKEIEHPDDSYRIYSIGRSIDEWRRKILISGKEKDKEQIKSLIMNDALRSYIDVKLDLLGVIASSYDKYTHTEIVYYTGDGFKPLYNGISYKLRPNEDDDYYNVLIELGVLYRQYNIS